MKRNIFESTAVVKAMFVVAFLGAASCSRAPDWYGPEGDSGLIVQFSLCRQVGVSTSVVLGRVATAAYPSRIIEVDGIEGNNKVEFTDIKIDAVHSIFGEAPVDALVGGKVSNKGDSRLGRLWLDDRRSAVSLLFFRRHYGLLPVLTKIYYPDEHGNFRFHSDDVDLPADSQGKRWEVVAAGELEATILDYRSSGVPCEPSPQVQDVDGGDAVPFNPDGGR